jgi:hypothetical protein
MHDTSTDQAIVLGASMAGLLAARVLSEPVPGSATSSGKRAGSCPAISSGKRGPA